MKYLLTSLLFIGSLLFSPKSFSEDNWTDTQRNFKPCQIMMDQLDAYAKIDPLKGFSTFHFTDWHDDPDREERLQRSFIYRAMKPGSGKAQLYFAQMGVENLDNLFERSNMNFPNTPSYLAGELYDRGNLQFYNLTQTSAYVIVTGLGGTARCIKSHTLRTTKTTDGYVLTESEPTFEEGDLCAPSDIAAVNVDGTDYLLVSENADWSDDDGSYRFYIELFPLGKRKEELSECGFRVNLTVNGEGVGTYKNAIPAPRDIWK